MLIKSPRHLEWIALSLIIIGYIAIRSLHFSKVVNFSTDQAVFATRSWEIWRNKEITLVGPTASFSYEGRFLIQSSAIFYTMLLFLLPAGFEPVAASYLFMLFSAAMCVPLYYGVKMLSNRKVALLITACYAFIPTFVQYTRFLWNPNFQVSLLPLLILTLGKYHVTKNKYWLMAAGLVTGWLTLYHYQFVLVIMALTGYLIIRKLSLRSLGCWVLGVVVGISPLIAFEVNSRFYLTQTAWLIWQHRSEFLQARGSEPFPMHYVLSFLLIGLTILGIKCSKFVTTSVLVVSMLALVIISLRTFILAPPHAFGMADNWNYPLEEKTSRIIAEQHLDKFAVVNTLYETRASVQYYLLRAHDVKGWTQTYGQNHYLFIIANKNNDLWSNPAYEVQMFEGSDLKNKWELSEHFYLYLFEKSAPATTKNY